LTDFGFREKACPTSIPQLSASKSPNVFSVFARVEM
jgi:hypothetical protein